MAYAENTSVSVERSKAEIERTLSRYGARRFVSGWDQTHAMIQFEVDVDDSSRHVRFLVPLPDRKDPRFWQTPGNRRRRSAEQAYAQWEQACRQRWRALALAIKAKLEVVESGIATFEGEFLAHIILPNGRCVGDEIRPHIASAYELGTMQPLLPDYSSEPPA
jgi:hypothetical protein